MKKSVFVALAASAAAFATPAMAEMDRSTHFSGPYVQVFGGAAVQNNDGGDTLVFDTDGDGAFDDTVNTAAVPPVNAFNPGFCNGRAIGNSAAGGCTGDQDGEEYGIRLGYDARMGNLVVGALVEASKNDVTDYTTGFSTTPAAYTVSRDLDYALSLRGKLGYTPNGGALFYATGGVSWAKIDNGFATTNGANSFTLTDDDNMVMGYQVGGGAEIMLSDNISLGLEYLYNRYDEDESYVAVGQGTAPATNPFLLVSGGTDLRSSDDRFDFHSLRATLGFQF